MPNAIGGDMRLTKGQWVMYVYREEPLAKTYLFVLRSLVISVGGV